MAYNAAHHERVILVHVNFSAAKIIEDIVEFKELAHSAGADVLEVITTSRQMPTAKYFIGSGKALTLRDAVSANQADLVIFNHVLSPAQERNLEKLLQCRVIDRTGLILDIFAKRANSFEGKLQVELAQLHHWSTRLVRGWTHLERQRGGIGMRGPGETQLETDRRLIRHKIKLIMARLERLRKQRELSRRARRKATMPTVALVGYTNAGKSTLFNKLTGASAYVANQLFATLDPMLRRADFSETGPLVIADTVGFIRHLPHELIEAFHATLEEVKEADLLLHVVDSQDEQRDMHIHQVAQVLTNLGAESVPALVVYNKIDLQTGLKSGVMRDDEGKIKRVFVSAASGEGIHDLLQAIAEILGQHQSQQTIILSPKEARLRALLYSKKAVIAESIDDDGHYHLVVRLSRVELEKLFR